MLRAIIIENELKAIETLKKALEQYCPEVILTGNWTNIDDSIKGIREQQPDLVFLDIELDNGKTGFDLLEKIPDRNFEVIFVTAYNKYAVRAFHFSAVHYLEKPVDGTLLKEAIQRAKKRRTEMEFNMQLKVLTESLQNSNLLPRQIILPNPGHGDSIVVPVNDIIRVEASGPQSIFYVRWNGKIEKTMYSMNIGNIQKNMLQGYNDFVVIHESHIINRNHVTHYNTKSHSVKMADESFIRVADRRLTEFLRKFNRT